MITIQETEYCKLEIMYVPDPSLVKSLRDKACDSLRKDKVKLSGFRPGRATNQAIQQYLKPQLKEHLVKELVNEGIKDVIYEKDVKPIFQPQVKSSEIDGDKAWVSFETLIKPK